MLVREQRGLDIDSWTPTPHWDGERLDVDWALFTLYTPPSPDPSADVSGETPTMGTGHLESGAS